MQAAQIWVRVNRAVVACLRPCWMPSVKAFKRGIVAVSARELRTDPGSQ